MDHLAEGGPELLQIQHVVPRVDARLVQLIQRHQMVAHLVRGIAEHQHHLLHTGGNAAEQQGEAVAAEDGEGDAHSLAAGLGLHVGGDLLHRGIVALAAGHHGLGDSRHILVMGLDAVLLQCRQDRGDHALHHIVALTENGGANAPCHRTQCSAHMKNSFVLDSFGRTIAQHFYYILNTLLVKCNFLINGISISNFYLSQSPSCLTGGALCYESSVVSVRPSALLQPFRMNRSSTARVFAPSVK